MSRRNTGKGRPNARLTALNQLQQVLEQRRNLGDIDPDAKVGDQRDAAYASHLAYGVLRWLSALEWLADHLLQKPLKSRDRDVRLLLMMGLYQLWKDETAQHAAVHETAECARHIGKPWAVGLINAILRRFQREKDDWLQSLDTADARFAFPAWLLEDLKRDWPGTDEPGHDWRSIVEGSNAAAPLWLRLNRRFDRPQSLEALRAGDFEVTRHTLAEDAIRLEPTAAVNLIPGFSEGRLSVQDPAAQLATELLPVDKGDRVLDACCAPGGKTCHLLERYEKIQLTALDRSPARLGRVQENLARLGLPGDSRVDLLPGDAGNPGEWWDGKPYRHILLDAPCTATGVIRRHPEIKWLRDRAQVEHSAASQRRLLEALWPLLEPGGMLLYATCSVLHAENSDQIRHFIGNHHDASLQPIDGDWGMDTGYGRQILPGDHGMDGFFYALLSKSAA